MTRISHKRTGSTGNRSLSRQFRALRVEAVLTAPGTAILLGLTGLGTLAATIGERTDLLAPGAWVWIGGLGLVVTACKVMLDFVDRSDDAAIWQQLLTERFAGTGEADPEITRLTDLAIQMRCRLAEAEARTDDNGRALVGDSMTALDAWIDGIARLAGRLGELRGEGRFQTGLAVTGRTRLAQIEVQTRTARDPDLLRQLSRTADGLRHQIKAADRFRSFADSGFLQLEHAVAALGTAGAQLMLIMTRGADIAGPEALGARIGREVAALEGLLQALDRVAGSVADDPPLADPSPAPPAPGLPAALATTTTGPDEASPDTTCARPDADPRNPDRWVQ